MDDFHYIIRKLTKGNIDLKIDIKPLLRTVITYTKVCRLCLKDNCLRSAADTFEGDLKNFDIVWTLLGIIIPNEFNIMICESCLDVLSSFHKYRQKCKTNNRAMLKLEGYLDEIRGKKTDTVLHCEDSVGDPLEDLQPVQESADIEIEVKPEPIEMEIEAVIESSVTVPAQIVKEELQVTHENTGQILKKYMSPRMFKTHIQCPSCQLHMLRINFKKHLNVHVSQYEYKQKIAAELSSADLNVETSSEKSESIMLQPNSTEESEDIGLFVIDGQSFKEYKLCSKCGGYVHSSQFKMHIASHRSPPKIKGVERMTSNTDPKAATHDKEPSKINLVDREYFREYVSCPICQHYMHYHFINRHTATHMPGYKGRQVVVQDRIIDQALIKNAANNISKSTRPEVNELQNDVATVINGGLNDKYKYYCSACRYRSSVLGNINRHMENVHNIKVKRSNRKSTKNKPTFDCSVCPYRTTQRAVFETHFKLKHINSVNEYRCGACPYRSKIFANIKKHVKIIHAPNAIYPSTFSECAVSVQKHLNIQHQKKIDSSKICAIAPATADQKVSIIIGGLNGKCMYYCSACLYRSPIINNLKRHIIRQHNIEIQEKSKNSTTVSTKIVTQSTVAAELQINAECSLNSERYLTATTTKLSEPEIVIDKHSKEHMEEKDDTESMDDKSFLNDNVNAVNEVSNENTEAELFPVTEIIINEGIIEEKFTSDTETLIEVSSNSDKDIHVLTNDAESIDSIDRKCHFYCGLCKYRYKFSTELGIHIVKQHLKPPDEKSPFTDELPATLIECSSNDKYQFYCSACPYRCNHLCNIRRHINDQHNKATNKYKLIEESSSKKNYDCSLCEYRSNYFPNLERHIKVKHNIEVFKFAESKASTSELRVEQMNDIFQKSQKLKCTECDLMIPNYIFESHLQYHCEQKEKGKKLKRRKIKSDQYKYSCPVCQQKFMFPIQMQSHMKVHFPTSDQNAEKNQTVSIIKGGLNDIYKYYCSTCPYRTSQLGNVKRHIKNIHKIEIQEKSKNSTTASTKIDTQSTVAAELQINAECSLNSERYLTATATKLSEPEIVIDKHSKEHMEEKDDTESMDDKSFLNDTVNAINEVSNENREAELFPFTEVVINEGMQKVTTHKETLISKHIKEKSRIQTNNIKSTVSFEQEYKFYCDLCEYRSKQRGNIRRHVKTHALKTAKKSSCDVYLRCWLCSFFTECPISLLKHINIKHKKKIENSKTRAIEPATADQKVSIIKSWNDIYKYYCSTCPYRTSQLGNIKRHIKILHKIEIQEKTKNSTTVSTKIVTQSTVAAELQINAECSLNSERYLTATTTKLSEPVIVIDKHSKEHMEEKDDTESMDDKSFLNDTVNAINEVSNENREAELFPFTEVVINEGIIEEKFTSDTETLIEVSSNSDKDIHVKQSSKLTNDADRKYRCGLCDYRYKVSTELGIHIIKEHLKPPDEKSPFTDELPATLIECSSNDKYQFYCSACPYRCNHLCNIRRHINDQHNKATNKYKLIEESSSKKNYDCSLCEYRSNYFPNLERHIKVKHNIEVFKFAESKASTSELRVEQMNDIFQKNQKLKCTECDLMIPNYIFESHLQYHCEQKEKGKKLKRRKIKSDQYKYSCPVCQQKFMFPIQMQSHMKVHFPTSDQNAEKDRTVSYPCSFDQCACYFPSEEYRRLHEADHENIIRPSSNRKPPKTGLCDTCGENYSGPYQLQKHLRRHAGLNLYSCDICKKSFRVKGSLVGHMRTHTGERPFKCRYCSADYFNSLGRQMHERQTHTKEKPFKCKFCDKGFVCNVKLQNHITTHTGEKKYKCETCGMKFNNNCNQRAHQNVHLREQGKPLLVIRKKTRAQKKKPC